MTSSPEPHHDPSDGTKQSPPEMHELDRDTLQSENWIALFVAFFSIGSIFAWAVHQNQIGLDLGSLIPALSPRTAQAPSPTATKAPQKPSGSGAKSKGAIGASPKPRSIPRATPKTPPSTASPIPPTNITAPRKTTQKRVSASNPTKRNARPSAPVPASPNIAVAPAPPPSPVAKSNSPTGFLDVPKHHWASVYIAELARRNILDGFPNGTYQPSKPITRAEFAVFVGKAFNKPILREAVRFQDLSATFWGKDLIGEAVQTGFLNGYPDNVFQPEQKIPLVQIQAALATGLNLQLQTPANRILAKYKDAKQIPKWAQNKIAAAIESGIVVTDASSPQKLQPTRIATRADAAALIYQALVKEGRAKPLLQKR